MKSLFWGTFTIRGHYVALESKEATGGARHANAKLKDNFNQLTYRRNIFRQAPRKPKFFLFTF